ncbi:MAG: glycosyltransferase family 2 protein [Anaerolineae bacterium]|nr:glycosyltransferase family 2 protein [Anaerolineae bacterium]
MLLTVVTPAYNEAENLPILYERLRAVMQGLGLDWEWIIVDDHSADDTFAVVAEIARRDPRVRGIRLARNSGSHTAVTCGLHQARGDGAVVMAADLQDPPETLPELVAQWRAGAQVVWAVRARREGEKLSTLAFARLFYLLMRHVVGFRDMAASGADFFLLDRRVVDAFRQFRERNISLIALITWMGFRQATVTYTKQARLHGRSGWSLGKKLKLAVDSVTSFTYLPIRIMSCLGFAVAVGGFLYAGYVIISALTSRPLPGWSSLMAAVLVLGGIQMLMLGVLGEYLWRALDEARGRPRYLIEVTVSRAELDGEQGGDSSTS